MRYKSRRVLSFYLMLQTHYYHSIITYNSDSPRKLLSRVLLRMRQLYIQEWRVMVLLWWMWEEKLKKKDRQVVLCLCWDIKRRLVVHPSTWRTVTWSGVPRTSKKLTLLCSYTVLLLWLSPKTILSTVSFIVNFEILEKQHTKIHKK